MATEIFSAEPPTSSSNPPIFKAWLLFILVSSVGGFFVGMLAGVFLGGFLGVAGVPLEQIQLYCAILGFFVGLPVSFLAFRWSVNNYILKDLPKLKTTY